MRNACSISNLEFGFKISGPKSGISFSKFLDPSLESKFSSVYVENSSDLYRALYRLLRENLLRALYLWANADNFRI